MTGFPSRRQICLTLIIASALPLAVAYTSQYGFGLRPCELCLYQRIPYFANIVLGFVALFTNISYPRIATTLLYTAVMVFIAGAAVAFFHTGVEYKWWAGLDTCSNDAIPPNLSIDQLREIISRQPIVRCDKPAWSMFGITMAGYNFLTSLVLAGGLFFLIRKKI